MGSYAELLVILPPALDARRASGNGDCGRRISSGRAGEGWRAGPCFYRFKN